MQPTASRPHMPGYALLPADQGRGLLPWSWGVERLVRSRNYWVSTVAPPGRPHCMPVWGIWHDDTLWFSTGTDSRKARNLAANPACVVTTESAEEAVIVEGRAERLPVADAPATLAADYAAKYGMGYPDDSDVFAVRPVRAFGLIESAEEFTGSATRWEFGAG